MGALGTSFPVRTMPIPGTETSTVCQEYRRTSTTAVTFSGSSLLETQSSELGSDKDLSLWSTQSHRPSKLEAMQGHSHKSSRTEAAQSQSSSNTGYEGPELEAQQDQGYPGPKAKAQDQGSPGSKTAAKKGQSCLWLGLGTQQS